MKRNLSYLAVAALVLLLATPASAWLDPRDEMSACNYVSTEESYDGPGGTLLSRVTCDVDCDTPGAGEIFITQTTEDGVGVTEIREGTRTESGGVYTTIWNIYDSGYNLLGQDVHVYDWTDPATWVQEWTYYVWDGVQFNLYAYTSRTTTDANTDNMQVTYLYYDTTYRADPVIPDVVPVLGMAAAYSPGDDPGMLGNAKPDIDPRMLERVRNVFQVNVNTQREGAGMLSKYGQSVISPATTNPAGTYLKRILMGDREDDPGLDFNGFFHRWASWENDVDGNLTVQYGWTSDRDLNEPSNNWWQARVMQYPDGSPEFIENAHRYGDTYADHTDTFTTLNQFYMIEEQQYKVFTWSGADFTETNTITNGMGATTEYQTWTVVWD